MRSPSLVEIDDLGAVRRLAAAADATEQLRPIGLREVVSGPGAVAALPDLLIRLGVATGDRIAVLSDDVPKRCGDRDVLDVVVDRLAGSGSARTVLLAAGSGGVHADEATVEQAVSTVTGTGPAALVTVGSGTLADIGKVVAQRLDLAHVVVQTAASVNGYADDQSVLLRNGTKRTTPSRWPDALVIDSDVLAASPVAMTRAGLGDLLSTFTAAADWRLAALVGFDPAYAPTAVSVLRTGIDETLGSATDLASNDAEAVRRLARSLTHGGLAMGLAGRTSPSSGAEHTISHLLEMRAAAHGQPAAAHGAQVGAAAVVTARIWSRLRKRLLAGDLSVRPLDRERMAARVRAAFGPLDPSGAVAEECWTAYERKLTWVNGHLAELTAVCRQWTGVDAEFAGLLADPEVLIDTLTAAGAPATLTELDPSPGPEVARWAVANCHLMRDRFTVVDLAEATGSWDEADVDGVLA